MARQAYRSLLEIFYAGIENGEFSGYDHEGMMETDLDEAILKYLYSVYLTAGRLW